MILAVLDGNQILFCRIVRAHHHIQCTELPLNGEAHTYLIDASDIPSCIHKVHMSPCLSRSSIRQHFEVDDAFEICGQLIFNFYLGLPHMLTYVHVELRLVEAVPKCIIRDTEVCKSIAIVSGDWMAAICTLLSFVSVTLAISLYCIDFVLSLVVN